MANFTGIVQRLDVGTERGTEIHMDVMTDPLQFVVLPTDHPLYTPIFSLLMASAINKFPMLISCSDGPNDGRAGTVVFVEFVFPKNTL